MIMNAGGYHIPVLLSASIDALNIRPNGVYVDVTFGGGGHSREILKRLESGKLFAFDQDPDALQNVPDDDRFTLIPQNFRYLQNFLRMYGVTEVDGILADLGVSSHQFDETSRGFSIRGDAPLDMRMAQRGERTAATILNEAEEQDLARILRNYGEVKGAGRVVRAIVKKRNEQPFTTTGDLIRLLEPMVPATKRHKFLAQVFQALRIEVNDEMGALEDLLTQSERVLKPGGRLVVISYHSLEDRPVKRYLRSGNFEGEVKKDFYGNPITPFKTVSRGAILPDEEEMKTNSRARSARLRVAEKL
jgi:16S rRNA (cytosine1402-N4)-methyltransferase